MKTERLGWLADNPCYTRRFALYVGQRRRDSSVRAIAEELRLDGQAAKELGQRYLAEQPRQAGPPAPAATGVDEIAIGKGHSYRVVVSGLLLGWPIWSGGAGRPGASLDLSYAWLGPERAAQIRPAVRDMGEAFRNRTLQGGNAPHAWIAFGKFPVLGPPAVVQGQQALADGVSAQGGVRTARGLRDAGLGVAVLRAGA